MKYTYTRRLGSSKKEMAELAQGFFETCLAQFFEMHKSGLSYESVYRFSKALSEILPQYVQNFPNLNDEDIISLEKATGLQFDSANPDHANLGFWTANKDFQNRLAEGLIKILMNHKDFDMPEYNTVTLCNHLFAELRLYFICRYPTQKGQEYPEWILTTDSEKRKTSLFDPAQVGNMLFGDLMSNFVVGNSLTNSIRNSHKNSECTEQLSPEERILIFNHRKAAHPLIELCKGKWKGKWTFTGILMPILLDQAIKLEAISKGKTPMKLCKECGCVTPTLLRGKINAEYCFICKPTPGIKQRLRKRSSPAVLPRKVINPLTL